MTQLKTIGITRTPYPEKFAVPRQPGLVTAASCTIELTGPYANADCVRGLDAFSHIWVVFLFHEHLQLDWKALVRPPRLGGNEKVGVFASRSTFRPNPIGLSCVQLKSIEYKPKATCLHVAGGDWVDGTPVVDIKPYIAYSDAINDAHSGFAQQAPETKLQTVFSSNAEQDMAALQDHPQAQHLRDLITQVLQQDPRPAYQKAKSTDREYGMRLYDLNIRWVVQDQQNIVKAVRKHF